MATPRFVITAACIFALACGCSPLAFAAEPNTPTGEGGSQVGVTRDASAAAAESDDTESIAGDMGDSADGFVQGTPLIAEADIEEDSDSVAAHDERAIAVDGADGGKGDAPAVAYADSSAAPQATPATQTDGWVKKDGTTFFYEQGAPVTGSRCIDGDWYRFHQEDGHMLTGSQSIDGKWYWYSETTGAMMFGSRYFEGDWYRYDVMDGHMLMGAQCIDDNWYWYDRYEGYMRFGWQDINGHDYYYDPACGVMYFGTRQLADGSWALFHRYNGYVMSTDSNLASHLDFVINELDLGGLSDWDALRKAYDYVSAFTYISGSTLPEGDWATPFAIEMLDNHGGNCYRFAGLFCWLARYCGYDAGVVSGWVPGYAVAQAPHGWVEVYVNGETYVCDPDMNNAAPYRNWFMVTYDQAPTFYGRWN